MVTVNGMKVGLFRRMLLKAFFSRSYDAGTRPNDGPWLSFSAGYRSDEDRKLESNIENVREFSRDAARNNDLIRGLLTQLEDGVLGPEGFRLKCSFKDSKGNLKENVNNEIEEKFSIWSRPGNCEMTGQWSLRECIRLLFISMIRDGDGLANFVYDPKSPFGFKLYLLDALTVDEGLNVPEKNIRIGIKRDEWGAPLKYYLTKKSKDGHYGEDREHIEVNADRILHLYRPDFISQSRGMSEIRSINIKRLKTYFDSELTAANENSMKQGFFTKRDGFTDVHIRDQKGKLIGPEMFPQRSQNGAFDVLPEGWGFQSWDPNSPQSNFVPFTKANQHLITSALGLSYGSVTKDISGYSYSSSRQIVNWDTATFEKYQVFLIEHCMNKIYWNWLRPAFLEGAFSFRASELGKYRYPKWMARKKDWIDILRQIKAYSLAVEQKLCSRSTAANELFGVHWDDEIEQILREDERVGDIKPMGDVKIEEEDDASDKN